MGEINMWHCNIMTLKVLIVLVIAAMANVITWGISKKFSGARRHTVRILLFTIAASLIAWLMIGPDNVLRKPVRWTDHDSDIVEQAAFSLMIVIALWVGCISSPVAELIQQKLKKRNSKAEQTSPSPSGAD